jgi:hypothetical protein
MFRMLLQEAFRWIVALGTLAGSGALIGTTPLLQEAAQPLEIELADVELPPDEGVPEMVVEPAQGGVPQLAFHPAVMYRGDDECHELYTVRGSLKNHGPGVLEDIQITYTVPSDAELGPIDLAPESAGPLGTSAPLRVTMVVSTTGDWQEGNPAMVMIPLTATATTSAGEPVTATASVVIYNTCSGQEVIVPDEEDEMDQDDDGDQENGGMGIAGLAFHPEHLNAGGVCRETYTAQGSLKNHSATPATGVTLAYTEPTEFEGSIELVYGTGATLTSDKPLRFTVNVSPESDWWNSLGKGASITIEISAQDDSGNVATATMTVGNQCKESTGNGKKPVDDLGAPGKSAHSDKEMGKPDKPDKPDKPPHPLGGPPGQEKKNK